MASTAHSTTHRFLQLFVLLGLFSTLVTVSALVDAPGASGATDPGIDGSTLVLFASESITIRDRSTISSNGSTVDVVSMSDGSAPGFNVAVRGASAIGPDVRVIGDRLKVDVAASVADDVFYNEFLRNDGTIAGTIFDDLSVPVPVTDQPVLRIGNPGTIAVSVPPGGSETISPGDYDFIRVGAGGTLTLDGAGDYSTNYVAIENNANLHVDGHGGDVELLVTNSFRSARDAFFGPAPASTTIAEHIAVFVDGSNPNQPTAGRLRRRTEFHGTLFVQMTGPRAAIEQDSIVTGAIFGTRISVGPNAAVIAAPFFPSVAGPGDADLSIAKSDSADPVAPGDTLSYTIDVANAGPREAINVVVTDTLPAGVTLVSTTGCAEDAAGAPTCSLGDIAAGGAAQYTIEVTVDSGAVGTLTNNASVRSDTVDLNTANNSTFEDTSSASADLSITNTDSVDPVNAGDPLTYTVTVDNAGPGQATNVTVTDTLPAGVTFVSTAGCIEDVSPGGVPTCNLDTIASGASASFDIEVIVDSSTAAGTITNSASVTSDQSDPVLGNNSITEDTTVTTSADLGISKADDADPVVAGSSLTYTVTVANAGPSDATSVIVTDTPPAGVTLSSTDGCTEDPNGVPTCSLGTIASGSSASYDIVVTADAGTTGTITNTASVTSAVADPNTGDNTVTEDTTVDPPNADLSITKTDDVDPALPGNTVTYTIDVSNAGPQDATNVEVTDTLPAGVTFVSTSGCDEDPNGAPTCTLGTIASGSIASYTLAVSIDAGTSGSITNTASVSSSTLDLVSSNNSTTEDTTVNAPPTAVADGPAANSSPGDDFHTPFNTTLTVTTGTQVLLDNDTLGVPTATLTHFGSGDLGGTVTTNAAGATVNFGAAGSLTVNGDGTFDFTPDTGFLGEFSFAYRLTSSAGTSDATVTIAVGQAPSAVADARSAIGNVGIDTSIAPAFSVLGNDTGDGLTVAIDTTSTAGATIGHLGAGQFTYAPLPGYEGTDTFDYSITNTLGTDTATVTITVTDVIWFIDNSAGAAGNGTLATPFNTLAGFGAANGNVGATNPEAGDIIFIDETGNGAYTGGVSLLNGQVLIGTGATASIETITGITLSPNSNTLPSIGGVSPTIAESTTANGIDLASGNTVQGLDVSNTGGGVGIAGSGVGTLVIGEVGVTSNTGGIDLTSAGGDIITLAGVDITTTGGTGLSVDGVGAINVTGASNSIDSTSGPAVDLNTVTIGPGGVTFESVSASNTTAGIVLTGTGAGAFTVTGIGTTDASGGTIEMITGDGVRLESTAGLVTLKNMNIQDIGNMSGGFNTRSQHDAIHGQDVNGGLTLDNTDISRVSDMCINGATFGGAFPGVGATTWNGLAILNSTIEDCNRWHVSGTGDTSDEGAVRIVGLTGTVTVDASTIQRGGELMDLFTAPTGTLTMTVTNSNFFDAFKEFTSGGTVAIGKSCIDVTVEGTSDANVTIGGAGVFPNNEFINCGIASINVAKDTVPAGNSDIDVIIDNNQFRVTDQTSANGLFGNTPQGGVALRAGPGGIDTFDAIVSNNTFGVAVGPDDRIGSTTDEVANANGIPGNLGLLFESGASQARVNNNTFNGSINAPWINRAYGNGSASVLYRDNSYRGRDDYCCDGAFAFTVPGIPYSTSVQDGGSLDITIENDQFAVHDQLFLAQTETLEFNTPNVGAGGSTLCVALDSVSSPDGFEFDEDAGTISLYQGAVNNAVTGPDAGPHGTILETELADDGVRGGPSTHAASGVPTAGLDPPHVDIDGGAIDIIATPCTRPTGPQF